MPVLQHELPNDILLVSEHQVPAARRSLQPSNGRLSLPYPPHRPAAVRVAFEQAENTAVRTHEECRVAGERQRRVPCIEHDGGLGFAVVGTHDRQTGVVQDCEIPVVGRERQAGRCVPGDADAPRQRLTGRRVPGAHGVVFGQAGNERTALAGFDQPHRCGVADEIDVFIQTAHLGRRHSGRGDVDMPGTVTNRKQLRAWQRCYDVVATGTRCAALRCGHVAACRRQRRSIPEAQIAVTRSGHDDLLVVAVAQQVAGGIVAAQAEERTDNPSIDRAVHPETDVGPADQRTLPGG